MPTVFRSIAVFTLSLISCLAQTATSDALAGLVSATNALTAAAKADAATLVAQKAQIADLAAKLAAATQPPPAFPTGIVRYYQMTDSRHDQWIGTADPTLQSTIKANVARMGVYSSYFDDKLKWFPGAHAYVDSYAIYTGSDAAAQHPEWILKDPAGNKLYIPFGCGNNVCPQWAGDVGNPAFRAFQIQKVKDTVGKGYAGLFFDDMNLYLRIGNGQGQQVRPQDPRTGQPMTDAAWRGYMALLCEEARAALPGKEITHNSIWYATRDFYNDPASDRQIAAADYLFVEFGFGDGGITGGNWIWSLDALMKFSDYVHSKGRSLIWDEKSLADLPYGLAAYYLTQDGKDMFGCMELNLATWSPLLKLNLGLASGARYKWNGLWRRDFAGGMALVNEPQAGSVTVQLGGTFYDENGNAVSAVTLGAKQGKLLRKTR